MTAIIRTTYQAHTANGGKKKKKKKRETLIGE